MIVLIFLHPKKGFIIGQEIAMSYKEKNVKETSDSEVVIINKSPVCRSSITYFAPFNAILYSLYINIYQIFPNHSFVSSFVQLKLKTELIFLKVLWYSSSS